MLSARCALISVKRASKLPSTVSPHRQTLGPTEARLGQHETEFVLG